MKRIGLTGAISALAVALLIPASVSAHDTPTFGAHVDKAVCTHRGGSHGFGKVVLQMSAYARNDLADMPTPNYIVITGWVQEKINGVWVMLGGGTTATTQIYPDGTTGVFPDLLGLSLSFDTADHPRRRMMMKVEFFDDLESGDVRLGKISARTAAC